MRSMLTLLRRSPVYFIVVGLLGLGFRLLLVFCHAVVSGDAFWYGELAKTWMTTGTFGTIVLGEADPALFRLPGYPAFLAAIWYVTGVDHYGAVMIVQAFIDTFTCLLIADLAWHVFASARTAKAAFALAALCLFTADYTASPLTETLATLFTVLAFDLALRSLKSDNAPPRQRPAKWFWRWAGTGLAVGLGMLIRPDGAIVGAVIAGYMGCMGARHWMRSGVAVASRRWVAPLLVFAAFAAAPLIPWTIRNWRTFHVFQPLAPRYAMDPEEYVPMGYQHWVKTWIAEYVSVSDLYWPLGEEDLDVALAPNRAFDSPEERRTVEQLFRQHNESYVWSKELDSQLGRIADARIARHPWRYYVGLPSLRIADMWLRPRTEKWDVPMRWWQVAEHPADSMKAIGFGALNLLYVGAALWGLVVVWHRSRGGCESRWQPWTMLVAFVIVRSLFLGTLENPEPRYTLECYPIVIMFAAATLTFRNCRVASSPRAESHD